MPLEDPSFRFLCEAARAFLQGQPVSEEKLNESSELRRMALYHRLDPLFSETKQANQFRSLRLAAHLAKLAKEFETIGVPFLCLKGVVLAQQLWGDIGNRAAGDIDLWIAEDRMDDVHQLLTASGHVSKEGYFDLSESYRTSYRECKFHIGYNHEDTGISVEIHWRLGGTKTLFPLSFEEAFAKGVDVSISGFEYRTLSDLDNLVFLHMHAARHLWERLFWLLDLVKLHRNPKLPSSNSILERAA
ncbi:MAG: nucleotidyltransferase family protein, partial [Verrucomicrobiota bacterium]